MIHAHEQMSSSPWLHSSMNVMNSPSFIRDDSYFDRFFIKLLLLQDDNEVEEREVVIPSEADFDELIYFIHPYVILKGDIKRIQYHRPGRRDGWVTFNEKGWEEIKNRLDANKAIKLRIFTEKKRRKERLSRVFTNRTETNSRRSDQAIEVFSEKEKKFMNKHKEELSELESMGFRNKKRNIVSLRKHCGNIDIAMKELLGLHIENPRAKFRRELGMLQEVGIMDEKQILLSLMKHDGDILQVLREFFIP